MSGNERPHSGLTRRSFLKTTAVAAGASALTAAPTSTLAALAENGSGRSLEENTYSGICRGNCFQGCFVDFKVREGKVVGVSARDYPDTAYNRICPKGLSLPQRIYSADRLKYPMKRVGERGSDQWERISWDEAVDTICSTWKSLKGKYGANCIAQTSTAGNTGATLNAYSLLFALLGAVTVASDVDNALFKGTFDTVGYNVMQNSANDAIDIKNAKTVVLWSTNISESQIQQWHFIADAKECGATLICIDPNYTATAGKCDIHVPIRPGTDAALAMAMMNIVLENGWEDTDFLKKATVAPLLVKEDETYLRKSDLEGIASGETKAKGVDFVVWDKAAERDGLVGEVSDPALEGNYEVGGYRVTTAYSLLLQRIKEYTPEYASKICDVPVDLIYQITELYSQNSPSTIYEGLGFQHYVNGHTAYLGAATLAMVTGNLGKPGASCGFIRPGDMYNFSAVLTSSIAAAAKAGKYKPAKSITVPSNKLPETVASGKYADIGAPIKSLYVYKSNYLETLTDRKRQVEAFEGMELVVVADTYMTGTARYADIVLPITDWAELNDLHNRTLYPVTLFQEKAIEPLYESKTDFEVATLIGRGMGFEESFTRTSDEFLEDFLGNENWEKIRKEKALWMSYFSDNGYQYIHGENNVFPTPTKRAQFYLESPNRGLYNDTDYGQEIDYTKERMVYWEPPAEAWHETALYEKYPLSLWQEHAKWRTHTQFGYVPWIREMDPEPVVKINDRDAAARGISTGDVVRVFNDRGYVVLKAVVNSGARPGMVNIPHGWQENQFIEGHYCDLLNSTMNPIVANQCYNDCLVEIKKYEEG